LAKQVKTQCKFCCTSSDLFASRNLPVVLMSIREFNENQDSH